MPTHPVARQDLAKPASSGPGEAEEARLIARIRAGELRAFEALYRVYHPRLTRFFERMMRRPDLVPEVLNDTCLVIWHRCDSFNGLSKVSTWIFGIAYRTALKALQRFDESVADDHAAQRSDPGPGPEQDLQQRQLQLALLRALDELSPEHRAVLSLTYFHGMGCAEIAEIVDCPVDTVKTRMFYARKRLRALLPGRKEDWL